MRKLAMRGWVAAVMVFAACDDGTGPEAGALFKVQVNDEYFHVLVETGTQVAALEARLASGQEAVINGELQAGDAGFNAPWSWHLVPSTVHAPDMAIEVCDGWPGFVEEELDYWLGTVKRFCPWSAKVVERVR